MFWGIIGQAQGAIHFLLKYLKKDRREEK